MSVKVQPEITVNKQKRNVIYVTRKRKKKRKKIEKKQSLFERLHEKYMKRKWLVRIIFIIKCTISMVLVILEFVL